MHPTCHHLACTLCPFAQKPPHAPAFDQPACPTKGASWVSIGPEILKLNPEPNKFCSKVQMRFRGVNGLPKRRLEFKAVDDSETAFHPSKLANCEHRLCHAQALSKKTLSTVVPRVSNVSCRKRFGMCQTPNSFTTFVTPPKQCPTHFVSGPSLGRTFHIDTLLDTQPPASLHRTAATRERDPDDSAQTAR